MLARTLSWCGSRNTGFTRILHSQLWLMVRNTFEILHPPTHRHTADPTPVTNLDCGICVCLCLDFLSYSESSDRGESGDVAGPGLSTAGEQKSPSLHIPWSPNSAHQVVLASLPVQRPVSSPGEERQCRGHLRVEPLKYGYYKDEARSSL